MYQFDNQEILLAWKHYSCRNNAVVSIVLVKTNITFVMGEIMKTIRKGTN